MSTPQHPSHVVYHVRDTNKLDDKGNRKGIWTRIGTVWPTKSGTGFRIDIDYTPTKDGRTYLMPWPAREEGKEEAVTYEPDDDAW
jgi:hypothetical protein